MNTTSSRTHKLKRFVLNANICANMLMIHSLFVAMFTLAELLVVKQCAAWRHVFFRVTGTRCSRAGCFAWSPAVSLGPTQASGVVISFLVADPAPAADNGSDINTVRVQIKAWSIKSIFGFIWIIFMQIRFSVLSGSTLGLKGQTNHEVSELV